MTRKKFDYTHRFSKVIYTSLENRDTSDNKVLKRVKPRQTEVVGVAPRDSVCSGCTVNHHQGDDTSR
jgi:hypothetical protein